MSYAGGHNEDYTWPRSRISAGPGEIRVWLSDNEDREWPPWLSPRRGEPQGVPARTVHVTTDVHPVGPVRHWTVKLRLAIDAEHEPEARAIAGEVIQAMDVAVAAGLNVTRSAGCRPFWDIVTNLDLSAAGNVRPDDALTRFRYVIRNLPGVTFMSPGPGDKRTGLYQWLPDEWTTAQNYDEFVHPAVRAAGVYVSARSED